MGTLDQEDAAIRKTSDERAALYQPSAIATEIFIDAVSFRAADGGVVSHSVRRGDVALDFAIGGVRYRAVLTRRVLP